MSKKRRAVGEIVAALILILISSIAGVLLFTTSLRASSAQGTILRSQILHDSESVQELFEVLNAVPDNGHIKIWIYNYGEFDIEISNVYINGKNAPEIIGKREILYDDPPSALTVEIPEGVSGPIFTISIVSKRGVKNVSEWGV